MQRDNTKDDDGAVPVLTRQERQSSESWDEPRHLVTQENHVDRQGFRKLPANRFGGDNRWELSEGKENPEVCDLKQDMLTLILLYVAAIHSRRSSWCLLNMLGKNLEKGLSLLWNLQINKKLVLDLHSVGAC